MKLDQNFQLKNIKGKKYKNEVETKMWSCKWVKYEFKTTKKEETWKTQKWMKNNRLGGGNEIRSKL